MKLYRWFVAFSYVFLILFKRLLLKVLCNAHTPQKIIFFFLSLYICFGGALGNFLSILHLHIVRLTNASSTTVVLSVLICTVQSYAASFTSDAQSFSLFSAERRRKKNFRLSRSSCGVRICGKLVGRWVSLLLEWPLRRALFYQYYCWKRRKTRFSW